AFERLDLARGAEPPLLNSSVCEMQRLPERWAGRNSAAPRSQSIPENRSADLVRRQGVWRRGPETPAPGQAPETNRRRSWAALGPPRRFGFVGQGRAGRSGWPAQWRESWRAARSWP